ncbi:VCBS repeat-containing protein [soil metagenome]
MIHCIGKNLSDAILKFLKKNFHSCRLPAKYSILLLLLFTKACNNPEKTESSDKLFSFLSADESGISFFNTLNSNDSLNILNYIYFYNGAGVGVGDINNDGLEDILLAGNQVSSRLYLNQGDMKFKDITNTSNITTGNWCTGVSMVDINADGYLDIYVSVAGSADPESRANLLFINNKDETFTEAAKEYGIADQSYTTHAVFFDYDLDGDLDLYLLNHANDRSALNTPLPKKVKGEGASNDKLYRNNGPGKAFTDVTIEAGINIEGYGLGVAVSDINNDGWPDLYISNDFISNDLLYLNNGDGTFSNHIAEMIRDQTYNAMGNDVSDFNNDGLVDVVVVDMLPFDPVREKTMAGSMTRDKFRTILSMKYEPQFMRNTLQLNQGNNSFIEIGRLSGIHRTDWSWSPLFLDLDNDGWKDLYITNGYLKDITDKDFIDYSNNLTMFKDEETGNRETLQRIEELEGINLSNIVFRNNSDLTFSDRTDEWGLMKASFSNGSAFSDLDNDGDLDLIVNNINGPAFILRNNSNTKANYFQVKLTGTASNKSALGAKVEISTTSGIQFAEKTLYRGFMSTVTDVIHFGLGNDSVIHMLKVIWPDGTLQKLADIKANQVFHITYDQRADGGKLNIDEPADQNIFLEEDTLININYTHRSNYNYEFNSQPTLPYRLSGKGPALATGDLDNNGLEDLYVGGDMNNPGNIFFQQADGTFHKVVLPETKGREVLDAVIFDANGDGYQDLYLACGGVNFPNGHHKYQDLLYFGTGSYDLLLSKNFLPVLKTSSACVAAGDFDGDGDLDLFIGGYSEPQNFPAPPRSYLLRNDNNKFIDVTEELAPDLLRPGLVRDAVWTDYNNDGKNDLVIVGEWMPVMVFENMDGKLQNKTESLDLKGNTGWWQSIIAGDFDNDGDIDLLAGNLGLNSGYKASPEMPVQLYAPDLNKDGIFDPIMSYFIHGKETISSSREVFLSRNPLYQKKFPSHLTFGQAKIEDIIPKDELSDVYRVESRNFSSLLLKNNKNISFEPDTLPVRAQLFPINTILQHEINDNTIFFLAGGFENAATDGSSFGISGLIPLLFNSGNNIIVPDHPVIQFEGDVYDMAVLSLQGGDKLLILGISNNKMKIYKINYSNKFQ